VTSHSISTSFGDGRAGLCNIETISTIHMPLFHIMFAPVAGLIGERPTILYWMRFILLPMCFVAVWCTYQIGTRLFSQRAGVWAVLGVAFFSGYYSSVFEFRTDNLWTPVWLLCITVLIGCATSNSDNQKAKRRSNSSRSVVTKRKSNCRAGASSPTGPTRAIAQAQRARNNHRGWFHSLDFETTAYASLGPPAFRETDTRGGTDSLYFGPGCQGSMALSKCAASGSFLSYRPA